MIRDKQQKHHRWVAMTGRLLALGMQTIPWVSFSLRRCFVVYFPGGREVKGGGTRSHFFIPHLPSGRSHFFI
ncbi:MAG: hypothetical protein ACHBN1_24905 [Heteroscytonema crispum UTEX LB 1556]